MDERDGRLIEDRLDEAVEVARRLRNEQVALVAKLADLVTQALRRGGKVLFCGNGGSAADATHLAAELVSRFRLDRAPLPALSLTDNASALTGIGNDYSYEEVFARQVRAQGRSGDVLIALSTGGESANVLAAVAAAAAIGMRTAAFTGAGGGRLAAAADLCLEVPSEDTPRIQEGYMLVGHTVCEIVEQRLAGSP